MPPMPSPPVPIGRPPAAAAKAAAIAATIFDVAAFRHVIQTHCNSPSPNPAIVAGRQVQVQSRIAARNAFRPNSVQIDMVPRCFKRKPPFSR